MDSSIPEEEFDLCHELANTAYLNLGLMNDLFSWQKEYDAAVAMGQGYVINVISVLMEERGVSEEEAKRICREKIQVTNADFRKVVKDTKERTDVSVDRKRYLEGIQYTMSGSVVWSLESPRYQFRTSYNERQLDWMKKGIPKPEKVCTNGNVTLETGSFEPKTTMTNGIGNGNVQCPTTKLTNGSSRPRTTNGDTPSSNGMNDASLVDLFAKKINGLDEVKIHDENTAQSSAGVQFHPKGVLQQNMEDLDTKVKA